MTEILRRDLGEGLTLRQATAEDTDAAAEFQAQVHLPHTFAESFRIWTRDLMSGALPGFQPGDFTVVEDTRSGAIVSMLNLIPQTWSYGGMEIGVGRIELVSTHPDYRRRGLVRAQMDAVYEMSAGRGEKMQVISGIPWFYRQFGYEMALEFGMGYSCPVSNWPALGDAVREPCTVRPAAEGDLPFMARLYDAAMGRYLVSCVRGERLWRYELNGRSGNTYSELEICVVEAATGEPVGLIVHIRGLWDGEPCVILYELKEGVSWREVTPGVVRHLWRMGEAYSARQARRAFRNVAFELGTEHPAYEVMHDRSPRMKRIRAWYVRVPDIAGFLRHVMPVLERRLADSAAAGYGGRLTIGFVDHGVDLLFDNGRVAEVERLARPRKGGNWLNSGTCDAFFPGLVFLQLLFGFRAADELQYAIPDCDIGSPETRSLLNALFPKLPSHVWGVW